MTPWRFRQAITPMRLKPRGHDQVLCAGNLELQRKAYRVQLNIFRNEMRLYVSVFSRP